MTETLREKLRLEVRRHRFMVTGCSDQPMCCSCQEGCCDEQGWMLTMTPDEHLDHIADAILAIPGIAVVELPEVDERTEACPDCEPTNHGVFVTGGWYPPADARILAARILACANYAEREQR